MSESKRRANKRGNGVFLVTDKDILKLLRNPCASCGSMDNLTIDHVMPLSLGGRHSIGNFQTLCSSCNSSKHTKLMSKWKQERNLYGSLR
jgi:5-methylcytosine-specific restriction endonuclease McrA